MFSCSSVLVRTLLLCSMKGALCDLMMKGVCLSQRDWLMNGIVRSDNGDSLLSKCACIKESLRLHTYSPSPFRTDTQYSVSRNLLAAAAQVSRRSF